MTRKDCDNSNPGADARRRIAMRPLWAIALITAACCVAWSPQAMGGSVRLWPEVVVVEDQVRLNDLCELGGFSRDEELTLSEVVVSRAPEAGGSMLIHLEMVRSALASSGINMARVTLGGSIVCAASRPARIVAPTRIDDTRKAQATPPSDAGGASPEEPAHVENAVDTLRQAVIDYFNDELARFGGKAEVTLNRISEQILELSGPQYEFVVRRRNGAPLGLVHLEVSILARGAVVQTVPLVADVRLICSVVVARAPINQRAVIRQSDVRLMRMAFGRIDRIGMGQVETVVGQRAKRYLPAGTLIEAGDLEPIPLVARGQIVTLESVEGSIAVVTTGKAAESGYLGDVVIVRDMKNRRTQYEGLIVGPGKVRVGGSPIEGLRLASAGER